MRGEGADEDDYKDVPDTIEEVSVSARGDKFVVLRWSAPPDNGLPILRYQVFLQAWVPFVPCGRLPAQEEDGLPNEADPSSVDLLDETAAASQHSSTFVRASAMLEAAPAQGPSSQPEHLSDLPLAATRTQARALAQLLEATLEQVSGPHLEPGVCEFQVEFPGSGAGDSAEAPQGSASGTAGTLLEHCLGLLPVAAWVNVRARNEEGWAPWVARPTLVLLRGPPLFPPGSVLHTWGLGDDGRLGRGPAAVQRGVCAEAGAVEGLGHRSVAALALGSHTAVVTAEDELFVAGTFLAGSSGESSDGAAAPESREEDEVDLVVQLEKQPTDFVPHAAACGRFNTAVISADGRLYMWGPNHSFQCGRREPEMLREIMLVQMPERAPIVQVALGEFHGVALTAYGTVLVWGMEQGPSVPVRPLNLGPRLGRMPDSAAFSQAVPRTLDLPKQVAQIAAGGYHSGMITVDGRVWCWGSNDHGQLGLGLEVPAQFAPRPLDPFPRDSGSRVAQLSCGGFHTAALDDAGRVFTWGDNRRGQCGQGDACATVDRPALVVFARGHTRCLYVSCGGFFTIFRCAGEGSGGSAFYACGWGKEGCLGFGQPCKKMLRPQPIPHGERWQHIQAGMVHVAGLRAP